MLLGPGAKGRRDPGSLSSGDRRPAGHRETPMQHPILKLIDGAKDRPLQDAEAYEELAAMCEGALTRLSLSEECASTLRRCACAARRAGALPPRALRPASQSG